MPASRLVFFAIKSDLEPVLTAIESVHPLKYVQSGLFDNPNVPAYSSFRNIPEFAIAKRGDANHEPSFLVASSQSNVHVRTVPQRKGGSKFAVDHMANPETIRLQPGGRFESIAVIAGGVSTSSDSERSRSLFKALARELKRRFAKIQSYYVGNDAECLLDAGCRFTTGVGSSLACDLRLPTESNEDRKGGDRH